MTLNHIVAISSNFAIGKNNELLWHYPEDLKNFKNITLNKIIIMGRKTYDSIFKLKNKPLPDRLHIVISKEKIVSQFENVIYVQSISDSYKTADYMIQNQKYPEDVFIIGGEQIYRQTLSDCKKLYVTKINKEYNADAFYPSNIEETFELISTQTSPENAELTYEIWNKIHT